MSAPPQENGEKPFEPTPQKLQRAREKGEVAKSTDISVAAAYAGLILAALGFGEQMLRQFGSGLMVFFDRPDHLAQLVFAGPASAALGGLAFELAASLAPWFAIPAILVLLSIIAQRALVVAPDRVVPKMSRISLIANAKNKFGRAGLFEFFKSFTKLVLYSVCLGLFLYLHLADMIGVVNTSPRTAVVLLAVLCVRFLILSLLISVAVGAVDGVWQHFEHRRKNRMSRKEIADESKETEGDPHIKQQRRQRGQQIASAQMLADVPSADVVIVNPTHFAVALKWSREPGSAPVCVAKGVDEIAARIRQAAIEAVVPIHLDPPTARALHATTDVGQEISPDHYAPVAAAIRFAEAMRHKVRERGLN